VAQVTATPATVMTNEVVTFNAGGSSDPDGDALGFAWRVDAGDVAGDSSTLQRSFAVPGPHTVTVLVSDGHGAIATASAPVTVTNRDPAALFTYSPDPFAKGQTVTFRSESTDPEGQPLAHAWDLDGDGELDDGTGAVVTHSYDSSNAVSVGLRVDDGQGGTSTTTLVLIPGNKGPRASFGPSAAVVGTPVAFTANASDDDGKIIRYAWDFDADGEFDDGSTDQPFWTFTTAGPHRVGLRVTDDDRSTLVVFRDVSVAPAPVPNSARTTLGHLSPWPLVRLAGALTRSGAWLRVLSVRAGAGVRVRVWCRGSRGCPKPLSKRSRGGVKRLHRFERRYEAGTRLALRITDGTRIGAYVAIRIRHGKPPLRRDLCLWPGNSKPRRCRTA
jgi:PKD repeat protein